jgi:hypothetical protein
MKSAKSAVAHLAGMCWGMERDDDPSVSVALSRFLDGAPEVTRPEPVPPPCERGELTIVEVHSSPDSVEHIRRVREWARTAWEAWGKHHAQARIWLEAARSRGGGRKGGR